MSQGLSCGALTGEFVKDVGGGAIGGAINGVIVSTFSWVAVSMGTFAWVGAVGGVCGGAAGASVSIALQCAGMPESGAKTAGMVASIVIGMIVQAAIFMGAGMTAGAAFTAAASTLIIPAAVLGVFALVIIAAKCCCGDLSSNAEYL